MNPQTVINDSVGWKPIWTVTKYENEEAFKAGKHFEKKVTPGNLLLNEGIAVLLTLLAGTGGTNFGNANARVGVGDNNTAAAANQTGLLATANEVYQAVEAGYPQINAQTITWRAIFNGATANFAWNEVTVANGADDSAVNLNRRVSAQGTKVAGQIWTLDCAITVS